MTEYYYIGTDGVIQQSGIDRIDPPDSGHQDYIDGQNSGEWQPNWGRRLNMDIVPYPEDANQLWDLTNNLWYYPKPYLRSEARMRRNNRINNNMVEYNSKEYPVDNTAVSIIGAIVQKASLEIGTDVRALNYRTTEESVDLTNADALEIFELISNERQRLFDAEISILDDIENDTITTPSEITTAIDSFSPLSRSTSYVGALMACADKAALAAQMDFGISEIDGLQTALDGKASSSHNHTASQITDFNTAADARISAQKGANSGLAPLDSGGKIASAYLPSYVDDVIEGANLGALPGTGETGKIYVTLNDNKAYRWSGSAYVEISASPGSTDAVTEGSTNLYFTNERAQDAVGAALSSEFFYNDGANTIGLRQRSFTNNASRSLVTGTGATGFQISSTRDAAVNYNVTTSTTATIGGASNVTVVLEIAPTNSSTAGDWVEISRFSNGQTISLAVVLQSVQTGAGNLGGIIPAGYYAKLRQTTSGIASATYNTGQEVLL